MFFRIRRKMIGSGKRFLIKQPTMNPKTWLPILLTLLLIGCCPDEAPTQQNPIHHIVLCWLKEPGNAKHRAQIIETAHSFKEIPGVLNVSVGEVIPSERKIVDDSFDVGITLTFAGVEEMNTYLEHPLHKEAAKETLMPLLSKVVVYDYQ